MTMQNSRIMQFEQIPHETFIPPVELIVYAHMLRTCAHRFDHTVPHDIINVRT